MSLSEAKEDGSSQQASFFFFFFALYCEAMSQAACRLCQSWDAAGQLEFVSLEGGGIAAPSGRLLVRVTAPVWGKCLHPHVNSVPQSNPLSLELGRKVHMLL